MSQPTARKSSFLLAAAVAAVALTPALSCVKRGYPLGARGSVDIRRNTKASLFASPAFDEKGNPIGPRQSPHYTDVTLFMSEDGEPAKGAFVDVRVDPPEALDLTAAGEDVETGAKTCERLEGIFRCTATNEGVAHFRAQSNSDWSSVTDEALLHVEWAGADSNNSVEPVRILPAGLPVDATNFQMIVTDLPNDRVTAHNDNIKCIIDAAGELSEKKWRTGKIRERAARVRATPPPNAPRSVENAPIIVESLSSEAALSFDQSCPEAAANEPLSRLVVQLDKDGQSQPFYLCFSDIGGLATFAFSSGEFSILNGSQDTQRQISVDAEPHLLQVQVASKQVKVDQEFNFEIIAYNANLEAMPMQIQASTSDESIVQLTENPVVTLQGQTAEINGQVLPVPTDIPVKAVAEGGPVHLVVRPNLFDTPKCPSPDVVVGP